MKPGKRLIYRVTTFVPPRSVKRVAGAVVAAGGACFGAYSDVFWMSSAGTEQFRPLAGASPRVGKTGSLSVLPSRQVIFSLPKNETLLQEVLHALRAAHPWEEPVIYIDESRIG